MRHARYFSSLVFCVLSAGALSTSGEEGESRPSAKTAEQAAAEKEALKSLQDMVGEWKSGVGQPRRGSTVGAWIEGEADWAWKFEKGRSALVYQASKAKYFTAGRLEAGEKPGQFRFIATLADTKSELIYTGSQDDEGRLVLTAVKPPPGETPARISMRTVASGDRLLVLYERRVGDSDRFLRLAEVSHTRKDSDFGQIARARECVVTGGAGTIQVSHKGQTYWVCCTGCRDLFNDDPEGVLAEYKERKEKEKRKKK
jgi:hypothetical protein